MWSSWELNTFAAFSFEEITSIIRRHALPTASQLGHNSGDSNKRASAAASPRRSPIGSADATDLEDGTVPNPLDHAPRRGTAGTAAEMGSDDHDGRATSPGRRSGTL
ncbi:hypothetical protein HDV00_012242 [Rhizophlyctis rosea]|nr:hypothetical protein HDV00_012242 [Rhizophlyctis rosea]